MRDNRAFCREVGENIRAYRRIQNMKQSTLAYLLGRSVACISKYERGETDISMLTLVEIAEILGVSVQNLLPKETAITPQSPAPRELPAMLGEQPLYFYLYLGEKKQMIPNALEIDPVSMDSMIYAYAEKEYRNCAFILNGTCYTSDSTTVIFCKNNYRRGDFVVICINNNDFFTTGDVVATLVSLSPSSQIRTTKCLLSNKWITDEKRIAEALQFNKEELAFLKKNGSIVI